MSADAAFAGYVIPQELEDLRATRPGRFDRQIVPVPIKSRSGAIERAQDDHVGKAPSIEAPARLKSVLKDDGTVTAASAASMKAHRRHGAPQPGPRVLVTLCVGGGQGIALLSERQ